MTTETKQSKAKAEPKKAAPKAAASSKASPVEAPAKAASKKPAADQKTIVVKMVGSPIRRDSRQREYLKGLGLRKIGSTKTLQDSPHVRGLIAKAQHMVQVVA